MKITDMTNQSKAAQGILKRKIGRWQGLLFKSWLPHHEPQQQLKK